MPKIDACLMRAAKAAPALCLGFVLSFALGREAAALYDVKPGDAAGKPGSIIRVWPLEGGGPGGANAFRILYRSTQPRRRADCRLRRHLHSAGVASAGWPQRDCLGA